MNEIDLLDGGVNTITDIIKNPNTVDFGSNNTYNVGIAYYQHSQATASSSWTFNHDLGRPVTAALVEDSAGNDWACQITNNSISNVTLYIGQVMGGTAKII